MWFVAHLIGALILAIALGLGSAYLSVMSLRDNKAVANGPWATSLAIGGSSADMYTRDYVALSGLFALNTEETIYYEASKDSAGEPIDGRCSYRIEGRDPDARWWSITLYGNDNFLIANPSNRYAVSKTNVARNAEGSWVIRLSTSEEPNNWIATSLGGFQITLRLYNPGESVRNDPATAPLPVIVKEACT